MTYLILSILATWRLTHLLSKEDGPFDLVFILKKSRSRFLRKPARLLLLPEPVDRIAIRNMVGQGMDRDCIVLVGHFRRSLFAGTRQH